MLVASHAPCGTPALTGQGESPTVARVDVDDFTREALALVADSSIGGLRVVRSSMH
jgi:hypothetical protein